MYHNTNRETGEQLQASMAAAETQEQTILRHFKQTGKGMTPEDVHRDLFCNRVPLTSVRRAISSLTAEGQLEKLDRMRVGQYGKKVHVWIIAGIPF